MRKATLQTLKALYEGVEVNASNSLKFGTTRITNEIATLRNEHNIKIETQKVKLDSKKWYGNYKLVRSSENLQNVKRLLKSQDTNEAKGSN